jgi:hypothetical protein
MPPLRANTKFGKSGTYTGDTRTKTLDKPGGRHACIDSRQWSRGQGPGPRVHGDRLPQLGIECVDPGQEWLDMDRSDKPAMTVHRGR